MTLRPTPPDPPLPDADALLALLVQKQRQGQLAAGWPAMVAELQRDLEPGGLLLWGTYHDAGGQLDAFRRLVGPGGLRGLGAVMLEQLDADGRWQGVPAQKQVGDSADLERYLARGGSRALERVMAGQRRSNYTGWKYGYLHVVQDMIVTARGAGLRLLPCDMPPALLRLASRAKEATDRLRELHCLMALHDALAGQGPPPVVAMAWGQAHLAPDALPRFVPRDRRVVAVHVFGHRPGPAGMEQRLAQRLALDGPVLVRLGVYRYLALLDGPDLKARVERTADPAPSYSGSGDGAQLVVSSDAAGHLFVGGQRVALRPDEPASLVLAPGSYPYLLQCAGRILLGAVHLTLNGQVEIGLWPSARRIEVMLRGGE